MMDLGFALAYAVYFWIGCYQIERENKKVELSQKMVMAVGANP